MPRVPTVRGLVARLAKTRSLGRKRSMLQITDENFIGFDKYRSAGAYHWRELEHNDEYSEKVALIADRLRAEDAVLDLGCGDGAYVSRLAGVCASVVGIDADFDAIRVGNEQLQHVGLHNASLHQMPLSQVSLERLGRGQGFDVVSSMDVIEHLPNPHELLEVARRCCRPGGTVIIGTPLYIRDDLVSEYHVKEFTHAEIAGLVAEHLDVREELVLAGTRLDGRRYDEAFYVAVCAAR